MRGSEGLGFSLAGLSITAIRNSNSTPKEGVSCGMVVVMVVVLVCLFCVYI